MLECDLEPNPPLPSESATLTLKSPSQMGQSQTEENALIRNKQEEQKRYFFTLFLLM